MSNGLKWCHTFRLASIVCGMILSHCKLSQAALPPIIWIRQFGTTAADINGGAAADTTGVYLTGLSYGSLGAANAGSSDVVFAKYDPLGNPTWIRQVGANNNASEAGKGAAADGLGNVYFTGYTAGALFTTGGGGTDSFVSKYDQAGSNIWNRQLALPSNEIGLGIAADRLGNVYYGGSTDGAVPGGPTGMNPYAFITKYDSAGAQQWIREPGLGGHEIINGVTTDGLGNVYGTGTTSPLGSAEDAFLVKYDTNGNKIWVQQFGSTQSERAYGVATDPLHNVFVTGVTYGAYASPNAGAADIFLAKFDDSGNLLWKRQFGSSASDGEAGLAVTTDAVGNVIVAGTTSGSLNGSNAGGSDVFVTAFDGLGNSLLSLQFGTTQNDEARGVATDGVGNLYVTGHTGGDLGGPRVGDLDLFIADIALVPEPSPMVLLAIALPVLFLARVHYRPSCY